jgi:decaprenylphospho-beta-D-erythro-pentofuranosid-2-ulose 2-reductase
VSKPILIVGATSGIARPIAECLAREGHALILAGRDLEEMGKTAADLHLRHSVRVEVRRFEALDFPGHPAFFADCVRACDEPLHGVVVCHGVLIPQATAQQDFAAARQMIDVNYTSAVSILNEAANYLESQKAGFLCAISSVAGDRGRPSNYIYGSTKAALNTYLEGLRARLAKVGVAVTTVKPGFVDTRMTRGLQGMMLVAKPERVARDICRAIRRRRYEVYTPWFWRGIMAIVRAIPTFVFNRTKL